jgi:hypothetical protein
MVVPSSPFLVDNSFLKLVMPVHCRDMQVPSLYTAACRAAVVCSVGNCAAGWAAALCSATTRSGQIAMSKLQLTLPNSHQAHREDDLQVRLNRVKIRVVVVVELCILSFIADASRHTYNGCQDVCDLRKLSGLPGCCSCSAMRGHHLVYYIHLLCGSSTPRQVCQLFHDKCQVRQFSDACVRQQLRWASVRFPKSNSNCNVQW